MRAVDEKGRDGSGARLSGIVVGRHDVRIGLARVVERHCSLMSRNALVEVFIETGVPRVVLCHIKSCDTHGPAEIFKPERR